MKVFYCKCGCGAEFLLMDNEKLHDEVWGNNENPTNYYWYCPICRKQVAVQEEREI